MAYDYKIEDKQQYIRVEISGERIPGRAIKDIVPIWAETLDICREKKTNKLLAILKLTGEVTKIGSYNIVTLADRYGWDRQLQVALVEPEKNNLFTETIAVNRGYQLKIFESEQDALTWLLS